MAQEKKGEALPEIRASPATGFKFNVDAPEFKPRSVENQAPVSGYLYPYIPYFGTDIAGMGSDWFYFADQEPTNFMSNSQDNSEIYQKIVKQVEYQFSDNNLVVSDFLMKIMTKDPEGYVPMSVIASWKKIKSIGASNYTLIKALRTSTKLLVSDDGKKVRRKQLFTEHDKEELQSRTVVVENLPEDYTRQNLEKSFSVVGSVKNIRICHPLEPSAARPSKGDVIISNKLHALVEYETIDQAEKAAEKLNDERNWRKGLRVRLMLRRSPRSVLRNRRSDFDHPDMNSEDDQSPPPQFQASSTHIEQLLETNIESSRNVIRKTWGRGRAKCGSIQCHNGRGILSQCPQPSVLGQPEALIKHTKQGPRMPDGTRGFTMGRGKPIAPISGGPSLTAIGFQLRV